MNELAVQGANDTNESIDREAINEELDALTEELDRISSTTQFNKQNLLDGTFTDKNLQVGANSNQKISISIESMNATALGLTGKTVTTSYAAQTGVKYTGIAYNGLAINFTVSTLGRASALQSAKKALSQSIVNRYNTSNYAKQLDGTYKGLVDGKTYTNVNSAMAGDKKAAVSAMKIAVSGSFDKYVKTETTTATALADTTDTNRNVNVDSYKTANESIDAIQEAINRVSTQRSALGALQNRLEHTIANLDNVSENTQSAESRIRDTDMASEMVEYSKNNILAQAGQSMLAQSNQSTQGVLSLLQ
jgi:flagellin